MTRFKNIRSIMPAHIFVLKSLHDNEHSCILPFAARYITFCRKNRAIILPFAARYITFCRKVYYLLPQDGFVSHRFTNSYTDLYLLINNLKNNLINYSNKLFNKERGASKKVFGLFGRPLSYYSAMDKERCNSEYRNTTI